MTSLPTTDHTADARVHECALWIVSVDRSTLHRAMVPSARERFPDLSFRQVMDAFTEADELRRRAYAKAS